MTRDIVNGLWRLFTSNFMVSEVSLGGDGFLPPAFNESRILNSMNFVTTILDIFLQAAKSFRPNNVQPPSLASALKMKDQKDIPYINSKTSTFS